MHIVQALNRLMNVADKIEPCLETVLLRHILESNDQSDEEKNGRCHEKKSSLTSPYVLYETSFFFVISSL